MLVASLCVGFEIGAWPQTWHEADTHKLPSCSLGLPQSVSEALATWGDCTTLQALYCD